MRRHEKLVSLVQRMLELHKRNPRPPQEREMRKCEVDRQIHRLLYEFYGLTEERIK